MEGEKQEEREREREKERENDRKFDETETNARVSNSIDTPAYVGL